MHFRWYVSPAGTQLTKMQRIKGRRDAGDTLLSLSTLRTKKSISTTSVLMSASFFLCFCLFVLSYLVSVASNVFSGFLRFLLRGSKENRFLQHSEDYHQFWVKESLACWVVNWWLCDEGMNARGFEVNCWIL